MNTGSILFVEAERGLLSIIAQSCCQALDRRDVTAESATLKEGAIDPRAAEILTQHRLPPLRSELKVVREFGDKRFDIVIRLCTDNECDCPLLPGSPIVLYWRFASPQSDGRDGMQTVVEEIRLRVTDFFLHGYFEALIQQKRTFDSIMTSLPVGIIAHDLRRSIVYFSPNAERLTGFTQSEVLGKDCHDIFSPNFCGSNCAFCNGDLHAPKTPQFYGTSFLAKDGERREVEMAVVPLTSRGGEQIGVVAAIQDQTRLRRLEREVEATTEFSGIIGEDHKMQLIYDLIRDLAQCDFSVVITGESGTGKELIARAIHNESPRKDKLFVPINCGALPEGTLESELFGHVKGAFTGAIRDKKGRFELADGGTLFLDEVAELSPAMQVKLLRVLQEGTFEPVGSETTRRVDVRIISATNKNLREMVKKESFREDLFYRLAVVPIEVPPLRDRRNDIPVLAGHFLDSICSKLNRPGAKFADETLSVMLSYSWPGNVRQLQNAIQFSLIKCHDQTILPAHLPPEIGGTLASFLQQTTGDGEAKVGRRPKLSLESLELALRKAGGNKAKAARMLGVGRATLYNFIKENPHVAHLAE